MKIEVLAHDKCDPRMCESNSQFSIQTTYDCDFNAHYSKTDNTVSIYIDTGSNTTTKIVLSLNEFRRLQKLEINDLPPENLPDPLCFQY